MHPRDRIRWLETALQSVRRLNKKFSEAALLGNLGLAYSEIAEMEEAIRCYEKSLQMDRELNDSNGAASDLNNLGLIYQHLGEYETAQTLYEDALATFVKLEDRVDHKRFVELIFQDQPTTIFFFLRRLSIGGWLFPYHLQIHDE